ncbi:hypothetical protein [Clostridium tagluense]|uniref:hypothetical protein n=1 Tax=Clostridium tagluense TaxID=360422 RepID=UPI001CF539F2|nr:hypothetical protein [Clostridium tagluense]MCB2297053.1 hypothetical protein [Clostridium tagluense]
MIYSYVNSSISKGDIIAFLASGDIVKCRKFDKAIVCAVDSYYKVDDDIYKCIVVTDIGQEFNPSKFIKQTRYYLDSCYIFVSLGGTVLKINDDKTIEGFNEYKINKTEIKEIEFISDCMSIRIFGES